ncbi:Pre-mRNA-splicing factor syf2, partial [Fragariocoptes setiger]
MEDKLAKFRELKRQREEASNLNRREVIEEQRRAQLPANWERKREWTEKKIQNEEERLKAEELGEDYERQKLLKIQADQAEKWERKKASKRRPDPGFSTYEAATIRQHDRLVRQMKPDQRHYQELKKQVDEKIFYPKHDTELPRDIKDSPQAIERMIEDVNKQIETRSKRSRRRRFDDDADVDYINERNMKFNKKLERFYNKYTAEIKQNLERGTAL